MRIYPVIHCENFDQIRRNIDIASNFDIKGIFMINHNKMNYKQFRRAIEMVVYQHASEFEIGANFLDFHAASHDWNFIPGWMYEMSEFISGSGIQNLWLDNAGCDHEDDFYHANSFYSKLKRDCPKLKIFGGLHAKFMATLSIKDSMKKLYEFWPNSIPTISGKQTGEPPTIDFVNSAQNDDLHIDWSKDNLAIASGLSPDNISPFKGLISDCLIFK